MRAETGTAAAAARAPRPWAEPASRARRPSPDEAKAVEGNEGPKLVTEPVQGSEVTVEGYEGHKAVVTGIGKKGDLWVSIEGSKPELVKASKVKLVPPGSVAKLEVQAPAAAPVEVNSITKV